MSQRPGHVVVLGGGTAGWMAALLVHHRWGGEGTRVTLVESRYFDADAAEAELRALTGSIEPARHLKMRVGRIDNSWSKNCLAVGLAQGFIEPLEATALHIVMVTVESFLDTVDGKGATPEARIAFNQRIAWRYEGIRDYIVCHYRAAQRRDTDYWRDATGHDELSDSLKAIFTAWFTGRDLAEEVARQQIEGCYSAISWHCLLAGYGNFPDAAKLKPPEPGLRTSDMGEIFAFVQGCASNYPRHRDALAQIAA